MRSLGLGHSMMGWLVPRGDEAMTVYAALDVSMEKTAICVVNADGKIALEASTSSDAEAIADKRVRDVARADNVCRRLMTAPGVGAIVALSFRAAVDQPERFKSSKAIGACFGLTPRKYQSGESDRDGAISKAGDASVRLALFEAAHVILTRVSKWSKLKAWAVGVAKRRGAKRAKVALARKLGIVLHRMWIDATDFRWGQAA